MIPYLDTVKSKIMPISHRKIYTCSVVLSDICLYINFRMITQPEAWPFFDI